MIFRIEWNLIKCNEIISLGFVGVHCEAEIDFCLPNPCQHNGSCVNANDRFLCLCQPGKEYSDTVWWKNFLTSNQSDVIVFIVSAISSMQIQ